MFNTRLTITIKNNKVKELMTCLKTLLEEKKLTKRQQTNTRLVFILKI